MAFHSSWLQHYHYPNLHTPFSSVMAFLRLYYMSPLSAMITTSPAPYTRIIQTPSQPSHTSTCGSRFTNKWKK